MMNQNSGERAGAGGAFVFGVVLGFVGSALDFYSGYTLAAQPGMMMAAQDWGFGIILLGVLLTVTTLASLLGGPRRRYFGALMVAFGVAMLFVGISMYSGYTPMMQGAMLSGVGMVVVGALMAVNGALMSRSPMGVQPHRGD